jgi:hypothetical protein
MPRQARLDTPGALRRIMIRGVGTMLKSEVCYAMLLLQ